MTKFLVAAAAALAVSACGGPNPFAVVEDSSGSTTPPGTKSPSAASAIYRTEPTSEEAGYDGNGYATDISYDAAKDTFTVDNLAFDGDNEYSRGTKVKTLAGKYAVYEADTQFTDPENSKPINQYTHRAIYGVSRNGNTNFAIVRTGAYAGYGFGGFIYQRTGGVTLPSSGQAVYNGVMAGLRDFNGAGGLEYTTADIEIAIDFDDFDDSTGTRGDAVDGVITNRKIFDINGLDITDTVIARIETENAITLRSYPTATFTVGPGVMDDNGEILGTVQSYYTDSSGDTQTFETGNYYAIMSGDKAGQIVGVVVMESSIDPIASTVRETSGFVVYR
ncbi:hypothetical protein [Antarcticimicrobium sediminis]|uniref:Transferrin-binding protein B C-lobe/N-lobe beta barrel domain-containing protein n=1 Tax=Antarcticimicrobium sediminis TaxID=2546227 RepID=A0A4R5F162_9RHOB|nr:hypothetical protein [Antarcticimicrobium sediminis]TDE41174.1 hypothetical protein E1B25_02975 [Antarcticimicrobium sediminis]